MKKRMLGLFPVWILLFSFVNCSRNGPTITGDEVIVQAGKLDVYYSRGTSFKKTVMIFGGMELRQSGAFYNVSLAGLNIQAARSIYSRYPDFQKCKSPGAPLAQSAVQDLEIVAANADVLKHLKKALSGHKKSLEGDDMGVCVELEGEIISLKKVILREQGIDITNQIPSQFRQNYYLVEAAEVMPAKEALQKK